MRPPLQVSRGRPFESFPLIQSMAPQPPLRQIFLPERHYKLTAAAAPLIPQIGAGLLQATGHVNHQVFILALIKTWSDDMLKYVCATWKATCCIDACTNCRWGTREALLRGSRRFVDGHAAACEEPRFCCGDSATLTRPFPMTLAAWAPSNAMSSGTARSTRARQASLVFCKEFRSNYWLSNWSTMNQIPVHGFIPKDYFSTEKKTGPLRLNLFVS